MRRRKDSTVQKATAYSVSQLERLIARREELIRQNSETINRLKELLSRAEPIMNEADTLSSQLSATYRQRPGKVTRWLSPSSVDRHNAEVTSMEARQAEFCRRLRSILSKEAVAPAAFDDRNIHAFRSTIGHMHFWKHRLEEQNQTAAAYMARVRPELEKKRAVEEQEKAKARAKRESVQRLRAKASILDGTSRQLGAQIKPKLLEQLKVFPNCPYCGRPVEGEWHADHIYPLAMGGTSVVENMVLICPTCNQQKHALTLREFIIKQSLDRSRIEAMLTKLGKRF